MTDLNAAGRNVLRFLQRWNRGEVIATYDGETLFYRDLEALVELWRAGETRTEVATRMFRDGECVREWPCVDEDYGRHALEEDRGDFPGADIRLMTRTITTSEWTEVEL